jgi:hypothetical protein
MASVETASPPHETMEPLRRPVAGVLAGLAASIAALIAVLLIAWGHCGGGSGEDCNVELAIATLAAVPALLLVAAVLLLLSARATSRFLNRSLVVLALFVGLLPLALLSIEELWSLFVFGALLSGLVGYVVVPHKEEAPGDISHRHGLASMRRETASDSFYEALDEVFLRMEEMKGATADLRRKVDALRRR